MNGQGIWPMPLAGGQRQVFPVPGIIADQDAEFGSAFGAACLLRQQFPSAGNDMFAADASEHGGEAES